MLVTDIASCHFAGTQTRTRQTVAKLKEDLVKSQSLIRFLPTVTTRLFTTPIVLSVKGSLTRCPSQLLLKLSVTTKSKSLRSASFVFD